MLNLSAQIEVMLFFALKPVKRTEIVKQTNCSLADLAPALDLLKQRYRGENSGLRLMDHDDALQLVSAPELSEFVQKIMHTEMTGELTKPALETLTIIAYRGPVSKPELEMIRGINCSLILRNLLMRGLIKEQKRPNDLLEVYTVHEEFLQYLGLTSVQQLPDYLNLSSKQLIEELLKSQA